ncbi:TonB-dependent receptor plug domain-containing protein [Parahaliea mediterranea]|uniref:TonB-dependent receptor n=1 Tax=Parahaliea mediterranea TaxID=651086 RepID=A0A939DGZ8_9GAMM|nr:TonB-dependent receptor [Parahaliea mediterranea]MBN7797307.1 TonB-dependent receptor [Parahaliea mediterranea]
MTKHKAKPATHSLLAAAGFILLPLPASLQAQGNSPALEEVVVTGSHIRRPSQFDSPSPLSVVGREDMLDQGAATVVDVVKNLPENSGAEFQVDNLAQPLTSGTSNINLRNLGLGSTLVMINGQRQTLSAVAATDGSSFVDTNSLLPFIAIERMEILKDGAAATYGSDAVAGVVNFISRDNFDGFEIQANYQAAEHGDHSDAEFGAIWGGGNDSTHLMLAASYFDREAMYSADRDFTEGTALSSLGHPGTFLTSGGFVMDPGCGTVGGFPRDNGFCGFDYSPYFDLSPDEQRTQLFATARHDFSETVSGRLELAYNKTEVEHIASPSFPFLTFFPTVPEDNPGNLWGEDVSYFGRIQGAEAGPSVARNEYDTLRVAGNLEGQFANDWYWTAQGSYSEQEVFYDRPDTLQSRAVAALAGRGGPDNNQYWNPLAGADNDPAVIADMIGSTDMNGETSLLTFDAITSGELFELEAGTVMAAFGAHYRREELAHDWGEDYNNQEFLSLFGGPDYDAERDIYALFTEFSIPVTANLELQASARYEDYGDGVNSLDPKLGALWQPSDTLSFRGSVGTAFRAPSLFQTDATQASQANMYDPLTDSTVFRSAQTNGNPDLDPEQADVVNLGVTWENDTLELSLDYWYYDYEDLIVKQVPDAVVAQEVADTQAGLSGTPAQLAVTRDPASNLITLVQTDFINASSAETDGIDLSGQYRLDSGAGLFRFGTQWTWVNKYELRESGGSDTIDAVGSRNKLNFARSLPEWKGNISLDWALGAHSATAYLRYTDSYDDDNSGLEIDSHATVDLRYAYAFALGESEATLAVGAINVTDEEPPAVVDLLGYDTKVHDPRGRMLYLNLNYRL